MTPGLPSAMASILNMLANRYSDRGTIFTPKRIELKNGFNGHLATRDYLLNPKVA